METSTKNTIKYLILPLVICLCLTIYAAKLTGPDFLLHANFYDVGQGDAIFIETFLGTQVLIDGGPSSTVLERLSEDMPFWDRQIDMLVLTHPHLDHVAGLVDVLKRYSVKKVLLPEVKHDLGAYKEFLDLIDKKHIEKIYAKAGQRFWLDQATVLDIYYPNQPETDPKDLNDTSIVGKISFGKNKILLTGDAGINIEQQLLPLYNLDSDLLKVGHHGSKHSTSTQFLEEVSPNQAVIEVGQDNTYGHPTSETLENLKKVNTLIYRTDQDGTVRFVSDGVNLYRK